MNVYTKGDRVAISNKHGILSSDWAEVGMQGEVVKTRYDVVHVKFDSMPNIMAINQVWLEAAPEKVNVVYRINGSKGFTETLSEAQVKGLVTAGVLFHSTTFVHNDHIVKVYQNTDTGYEVYDRRTDRADLYKEFPRDN